MDAQQRASVGHALLEDISSVNGSFELGSSLVCSSQHNFFFVYFLNFLILEGFLSNEERPAQSP